MTGPDAIADATAAVVTTTTATTTTATTAATTTTSTTTEKSTSNPLEQFVLLAKTAKGAAALELIKQAVETPGVNVFGELLDMPNIKELENGKWMVVPSTFLTAAS
jgi:hypothetical protein